MICTRRPRLAIIGLTITLLACLLTACQPTSHTNTSPVACSGTQRVVIRKGDNLSQIVESHVKGRYPNAAVIQKVKDDNNLPTDQIHYGQKPLDVPLRCDRT